MIRKLLSKLFSSNSKDTSFADSTDKFLADYAEKQSPPTSGMAEKLEKQEVIKLNLDTGKLILPDSMSAEEKAEIEASMKELQESLQSLNKDAFQSLEQYLSEYGQPEASFTIPFTTANNLPDAQSQVLTEMLENKEDTDHWSDEDFIEALYGYYNGGYIFTGIEAISNKVNERRELSQDEKKKLRDWYMLATQELVYDV